MEDFFPYNDEHFIAHVVLHYTGFPPRLPGTVQWKKFLQERYLESGER